MVISKILVPTDFSDPSHESLTYASELAKLFGAEIRVLHIVEFNSFLVYGGDQFWPDQELQAEILVAADRQLAKYVENIPKDVRIGSHREVATTSPAAAICDDAKAWKADLIVLATHARKGLDHFLLGSVAEKVVRMADCPVLTLRKGPN